MIAVNVLYLTSGYPDIRGCKWARVFSESGHCFIVYRGRGARNDYYTGSEQKVVTYPALAKKVLFDPFLASKLCHDARDLHIDLVFARDVFVAGYGLYISRCLGVPFYVDVADNYPEVLLAVMPSPVNYILSSILSCWERFCLRGADKVIFVSPESRDYVAKKHGLLSNRLGVVYNVPLGMTPIPATVGEFRGRLVYIGTFDEGIRDLRTAIQGLQLYNAKGRRAQLSIYTFDEKDVRKCVCRLGVSEDLVKVYPPVPNAELPSLLAKFDVGIVPHVRHPATDYTVPNKIFDYLYCGLRVICSDNPSMENLLNRIGGGTTYRGGDPEDFARALTVIENQAQTGGMIADLQQLANEFEWRNQVRDLLTPKGNSLSNRRPTKQ